MDTDRNPYIYIYIPPHGQQRLGSKNLMVWRSLVAWSRTLRISEKASRPFWTSIDTGVRRAGDLSAYTFCMYLVGGGVGAFPPLPFPSPPFPSLHSLPPSLPRGGGGWGGCTRGVGVFWEGLPVWGGGCSGDDGPGPAAHQYLLMSIMASTLFRKFVTFETMQPETSKP